MWQIDTLFIQTLNKILYGDKGYSNCVH
jgi:hypothetical protein